MIPLIQRELDEFREVVWNSHRIRHQKNTFMPDGVPNHIYSFPEQYGLEKCGKFYILYTVYGTLCTVHHEKYIQNQMSTKHNNVNKTKHNIIVREK